jgi:membrane-associated protease RseP (regulator of RpoE activity)
LHGIAWLLGEPLRYSDPTLAVNPVVVGAWVGTFVTFLNLLPVGQLDGGHVLRAAIGERQATVAKAVPPALFGLAGLLFFVDGGGNAVGLWLLWGVLALLAGRAGSATPVVDRELDRRRKALAALTFLLGVLAFTPVPIQIGI